MQSLSKRRVKKTQPRWSLQNKRRRLKKGDGGGDLEKYFVPSAVKKAP